MCEFEFILGSIAMVRVAAGYAGYQFDCGIKDVWVIKMSCMLSFYLRH